MAGLNSLMSDVSQVATTLPSWYTTAQQNVANAAQQGYAAAPQTIGQTTAGGAINTLQANPFAQAAGTLQNISSGAANPWLVSTDATGAQTVSPNVSTPLGGLFKAQQDYFTKMMPGIEAEATAPYISGGGFGSSMNKAAVAREAGKAYADLAQKQMQAALTNQQTGVQAGLGVGTLTDEQIKQQLAVAEAQQKFPYASALNYANIVNAMKAPETKSTQTKLSPLSQAGVLSQLAGAGGTNAAARSIYEMVKKLNIPGLSSLLSSTAPSGTVVTNPDGTTTQTYDDGSTQTFDANGNVISSTPATESDIPEQWFYNPSTGIYEWSGDEQPVEETGLVEFGLPGE